MDLACGMDSADVLRMEADIAVQLTPPEAPDVIVSRLGYMHVMPCASRSYVAQHGCPASITDLATHRLTLQLAHRTSTTENLNRIFRGTPFTGTVAMTTNTSTAHALAIASGVGIGWLPTYVSPMQTGLVAIDCGAEVRLDIWMTYHPDAERIARVRRAIEWLRLSFDARRYPFFAENRIDPAKLPAMQHLAPLEDWMREASV